MKDGSFERLFEEPKKLWEVDYTYKSYMEDGHVNGEAFVTARDAEGAIRKARKCLQKTLAGSDDKWVADDTFEAVCVSLVGAVDVKAAAHAAKAALANGTEAE